VTYNQKAAPVVHKDGEIKDRRANSVFHTMKTATANKLKVDQTKTDSSPGTCLPALRSIFDGNKKKRAPVHQTAAEDPQGKQQIMMANGTKTHLSTLPALFKDLILGGAEHIKFSDLVLLS
jgi:hypothetical protein